MASAPPPSRASPLRIAIVCDRYDPRGGGAERHVAEVSRALVQRGHAVTVFPGSTSAAAEDEPARIEPFAADRIKTAGQLGAFRRWANERLQRADIDVSLSLNTTAPAAVVQPRGGTVRETRRQNRAAEPSRIRRALGCIGEALNPKRRALLTFEGRTMADPRVRCFVALSGYVVEQFERHYGVEPARIRLIPNAVNTAVLEGAERAERRAAMRRKLDLADDRPAYLFSAYNPKLKGAFALLEAWATLSRTHEGAVLMMTGRVTRRLHRRAERLGVVGSIRWIGATQRMADYYCAADVLVHPTYYDPSSRVVIEALRHGVPAITTRFNGAADLLLGPGNMWRGRVVAQPGEVDALADAMAELADPDARAACRRAMTGIEDELDFDRYVDQIEALLREAMA